MRRFITKKCKSITSIVLVLVMITTVFVGCSPKETGKQKVSGDKETTGSVKAEPFGKYDPGITITTVKSLKNTIKFDETNPETKSIEENIWVDAYKEELGIDLKYLWTSDESQYINKWNLAIASQNIPDVAVVPLQIFKNLAEGDLLQEVGPLFDQYASDMYKEYYNETSDLIEPYLMHDGKMMALPITGSDTSNGQIMMIRKDWLDNLNLDVPTTTDQLYEVAKAFTENDPDQNGKNDTYGLAASNQTNGPVCGLTGLYNGFHSYPEIWVERDDKLVWGSTLPETKDTLQYLRDMYSDGLLAQDFAVKDPFKAAEDIVPGKVGIAFGLFWAPYYKIINNIQEDEDAEWIAARLPAVDDEPVYQQSAGEIQEVFVVTKKCKNPEAAVKLLNLSCELPAKDWAKYSGTNSELNKNLYRVAYVDKPWKNIENTKLQIKVFETGDKSLLEGSYGDWEEFHYNKLVPAHEGDRSCYADMLAFDKGGTYEIINTYLQEGHVISDKYRTLLTENMMEMNTDLQEYLNQQYSKIIMGEESIDKFDDIVEEWYRRGGQILTDESNEWYQSTK